MIIQPFIENSTEHAFDMTNENWKIFKEHNRLRIDIMDNGSGYKSDRKS